MIKNKYGSLVLLILKVRGTISIVGKILSTDVKFHEIRQEEMLL